jgi:hypothetical protein
MNNPPYVIYTIGLDREGKPSRGNPKGEARCRFISTNSGFFLDQARSTKSQAKNTPPSHFQLTTSIMENNITLQNE